MKEITLYTQGTHQNILLEDTDELGLAVQANHHVIMHGGQAMVLDPGGHKSFNRLVGQVTGLLVGGGKVRYIFLSHQDPDILASTNGWLMVTDADAYISALWIRFVPHFGIDSLVEHRLKPIPDEGMWIELGGAPLCLLPAHFIHASGNFQVYDPTSQVLYSGDLGASLGITYREVTDFQAHIKSMEGFHRRYMPSGVALRAWAKMARTLDIRILAPQHGALFRGDDVKRFIDWVEGLSTGMDLMAERGYRVPPGP